MVTPLLRRAALSLILLGGCAQDAEPLLDPVDECATCDGKADSWGAPAEGSCEAQGIVKVANEASFAELDDDARLNRRAVERIVEAREASPFTSLRSVDDVRYVGVSALRGLLAYAHATGVVAACEEPASMFEIAVVSDLDKTVIPPAGDLDLPDAPYPGVTALFAILEHGSDGSGVGGDFTYVTARTPDRIEGVAEWLESHGLPAATIETGVSGAPWLAQPEKVIDIRRTFDARPEQSFVLFGDSSHRDPEVYRQILALYPERVRAGLIHRVNATVSESRLAGLHLHDHYAEAAAILAGLEVITLQDAWTVYRAAVAEGLELTEDEMQALIDEHGS